MADAIATPQKHGRSYFQNWSCISYSLRRHHSYQLEVEVELGQIQTQMAQEPMLRTEVYARALRTSQKVKESKVFVGARCA
jgi:fructose/tagatose bisphosphate aldolase